MTRSAATLPDDECTAPGVIALLGVVLLLVAASSIPASAEHAPAPDHFLAEVSAVSSHDVWAVGGARGCDPVTLHWDGARWNGVLAPKPVDTCATLGGVSALAASDVWAVGGVAPFGGGIQPFFLRWDGSAWNIVAGPSVPPYSHLEGVSAESATDVWAVGSQSINASFTETLIEHWDGSQWTVVGSPSVPGSDVTLLTTVATVSANDVWAVGYWFTFDEFVVHSVIEHWDGSGWSIVSHPDIGGLFGVASATADDVWAVGQGGKLHWDGTDWSVSGAGELYGVASISSTDAWAVGSESNGARQRTLAEHWNGTAWRRAPTRVDESSLEGVAAVSTREVWAVGFSVKVTPQFSIETLTLHWNGRRWQRVPSPNP